MIFGNTDNDIAPFTNEQWNKIMQWYKAMTIIAGVPMIIAVIILAYKIIVSGFSIDKRHEAKDNILRLFFGAVSISLAPLFVKFLLYLNNNLVKILVAQANGSLDGLLGNSLLTSIKTGNAILTSLVIALFAYLFVKLNIKFIIRQFTIIIFTIFTPIISVMWIINRKAVGASIWFGQILINIFMQFIYAFLFLVYLNFLPASSGWAVSLLWAMMILPLAEVLQNTLQNLVSRVAGVQSEELTNRGIGIAANMAHTLKAFAYQFKGVENSNVTSGLAKTFMNNTSFINGKAQEQIYTNPIKTQEVKTKEVQTKPVKTKEIGQKENENNQNNNDKNFSQQMNKKDIMNDKYKTSPIQKVAKVGSSFLNTGMYIAEGKNFNNSYNNKKYSQGKTSNTRKSNIKKQQDQNTSNNLEMEKSE